VTLIKCGGLGEKGFRVGFFFLEQGGSLVLYAAGTVALNSHCALSRAAVISTLTCVDFRFLSFTVQCGNGTCKPVTQITTHTSFGRASSD